MIVSRVSFVLLVGLLAGSAQAQVPVQVPAFDDRPSGFLNAQTGGMPADAWTGTNLAHAKRLVAALPAAPRSRALRDLQFKVLVSELRPPSYDGSAPPTLFARKVDRLAAMGEGESLNEMVRGVGGYRDPAIAAATANALMLAGEREGACSVARNNPMPQPFGQRAEAACRMVDGDGQLNPAMLATIDGPAMMMLAVANQQPPAATLRTTQPPLLRALVAHRSLPLATRLEIAERSEALAIIEAARLSDLYVQAIHEGTALPAPILRRAQLVASARNVSNAQEIVASLAAVYAEVRGSPMFPTIARSSSVGLLNLPAQPQYANVAQEAMRGFLLLGDKRRTEQWTKLALSAAYNNARAMLALDRLMPLVVIAGIDNPRRVLPEDMNRWYELLREDDPQRAPLRGYLLLELLRAVGYDIPLRSTHLPETPPGNVRLVGLPQATLQALDSAGQEGRRAETALLAAGGFGETALVDLHPASVGAVVRALRLAGEDEAARLFAIEIAIAYGL
jgi:hypothetical protein